jgi:Domain of unknown function (DUF4258)
LLTCLPDNSLYKDKQLTVNRKWLPYLLMALMLVAILLIRQCKGNEDPAPKPRVTNPDRPKDPASNPTNRDKGFDRRTSYLDYSQHASCRMQCRKISKSEVEEIMLDGKINYKKSDLQNARCPRYALEGVTQDNQRVRIIFAQCNEKTVVVTVIDLGTDYACDCPGDDDQYKNKGR